MSERLTLEIPPEWEQLRSVWDRCQAHLAARGVDLDAAYALCMVTQELLENAVKYGAFSPGQTIPCSISAGRETVTIEVRTPLDRNPERLKLLDEMIQWIRGFQNPFEAYVERLKQAAAQPYTSSESGLGLVRIAYEGQCLLDFYVDESNVLAMSAVYRPSAGLPL
jgi:hypothetical protein